MTDNLRTDAGKKTFATLRQIAKDKGRVEKTVLQLYALERFMQRIFACDHADKFVLKGGLTLCYAEGVAPIDARGTQDIDITLPEFTGSMDEFSRAPGRDVAGGEGEPAVRGRRSGLPGDGPGHPRARGAAARRAAADPWARGLGALG